MSKILSLPFELLKMIVSHLNQKDLYALIRTHRQFYLSLISYLYRHNKEHSKGSALLWGARNRQIRTVQYAIQESFDLEIKDEQHESLASTSLEIAVENRDYATTRLLVENGAIVDNTSRCCSITLSLALSDSCQKYIGRFTRSDDLESKALRSLKQMGHEELVDLVSRKDQVDVINFYGPIWSILVEAVSLCEANISIIRLLLDNRAERKSDRSIHLWAAQLGCCDTTLRLFLERESFSKAGDLIRRDDALCKAASLGNKAMINLLLEMGANPGELGSSGLGPLMYAARDGQFEALKLLMDKGADANSRSSDLSLLHETVLCTARKGLSSWKIDKKIRHGRPPSYSKDMEGKEKIVKYLLKQGVKK